jgi:thiosulfate/3-mercaptopyruvate sulfurtransferase
VAYDAGDGTYAGRLWWLLRAIGHEAVAVLDGGFARWQAEGRPVSTELPAPTPVSHDARWREGLTVNAAAVQQNLQRSGFTVLDARGSNRYEGRDETMDPVAGHIPGALNRPYAGNLEGGRFKSPERLREEFTALLGGTPPEQIVHQCGSGVSACCNLLAMEIAGLRGSRLYPGSWSDWVSDRTRPVATGPEPGGST